MEKQVLFRDQQEFQAADPNNLQTFVSDTIKHAVHDAVSSGLHYTGLDVTPQGSNTALDIAIGRIFNAGQIYTSDQGTTLDLFAHLPLTTQKIVAVVAWGQGVDTDIQPRDFLIDLAAGTTQPQAVAMQRLNQAVINVVPGVESASPQAPSIQSGTIAVAFVTLDPTGIVSITMQTGNKLPNAADHEQRIKQQEVWKAQAEPRISSIATDLSALAAKSQSMAKAQSLVDLEALVARINEQLNLPAAFAESESDNFADASKSDTAHAGYNVLVQGGGILLPHNTSVQAPIETFNPTDPTVTRTVGNMLFPAFSHQLAFDVSGYAGDVSISQYQSQAFPIRRRSIEHTRVHYGYHFQYVKYNANTRNRLAADNQTLAYEYDPQTGFRTVQSKNAFSNSQPINPYRADAGITTVNGSLIAQTVLSGSDFWLSQIGLFFTAVGATSDVHMIVCETIGGKPDLNQIINDIVIPVADLKLYPQETLVPVEPALIEAGKRYALVLITQGAHRVAITSNKAFTFGMLFNGQDGDYLVTGPTQDLMMRAYATSFASPRTEVMLASVNLAGGISDLDLAFQTRIPEGTSLDFEMQIGGIWYRMDDNVNHLSGAPAIVPLRAVFQGTNVLAPALQAGSNLLTASTPALAGEHWSTSHTLAAPSTAMQIDLIVDHNYDSTVDSCVVSIESVGSNAATLVEELPQSDGSIMLRFHFVGLVVTTYQIRIVTTLGAGSIPFSIAKRVTVAL